MYFINNNVKIILNNINENLNNYETSNIFIYI